MGPHLVSEILLADPKRQNRSRTTHRALHRRRWYHAAVFGGNNSYRRPHTPTSFCGRDKVAAIRPRGSALQLASCRLGDDCQGPSGGRINSSCSAWRCARPVGALAAARGTNDPSSFKWRGSPGGGGAVPDRAPEPLGRPDSLAAAVSVSCWLTAREAAQRGARRWREANVTNLRRCRLVFFFFTSFFIYDRRVIQVTAVQRSPRSLVDGNVPTVLVRLEIRFPLSGVPVQNELDSSFGYTGRLLQKSVNNLQVLNRN